MPNGVYSNAFSGRRLFSFMVLFSYLGQYCLLLYMAIRSCAEFGTYRKNLVSEIVKTGFDSIPLIVLTGAFTGAVMTIQTAYQIESGYFPNTIIGSIVTQSLVLELAAGITSLVLAGRVGARIATELGTMRVSEQIAALDSMGFNSVTFLVVPRIMAGILMFPVVYIVATTTGITGGVVAGMSTGAIVAEEFLMGAKPYFLPQDVAFGFIKSFVFGFVITSVACYKGFFASGGAEGVGRATTQAAVMGCTYVLLSDLILAFFFL